MYEFYVLVCFSLLCMVVLPLHTVIVFTIATLMNPKFLLQMRCLVCTNNKTEADGKKVHQRNKSAA